MYVAVKALALVGVSLFSTSAASPPALFVNMPAIHQVICLGGKGTAFEAGGKMISADHVTGNNFCTINGQRVDATAEPGDVSTIDLPASGYRINCEGFKKGEYYYAVGFAGGNPVQRLITLAGTGYYASNGMAILVGFPTVIPGMSGGIVMNSRGEAVGVVNMYSQIYPLSFSAELKETSLCRS